MKNLKELKVTDNIEANPNCVKSILSNGKKVYAYLPLFGNEGKYFEISESLAKHIIDEMELMIVYLVFNDNHVKINEDGSYVSSNYKISTKNPMNNVFMGK